MSYAYTAVEAAATTQTLPDGWLDGWTFPTTAWYTMDIDIDWSAAGTGYAFPPGWPIDGSAYTLTVTIPATVTVGGTVAVEARVLKSAADTDELNCHLIGVMFVCDGAIVQCKATSGGSWADSIVVQVSNYEGAKYGIYQAIYVNTDAGMDTKTLECYAAVVTVDPQVEGDDTGTITVGGGATYILDGRRRRIGQCLLGAYPTEAAYSNTNGKVAGKVKHATYTSRNRMIAVNAAGADHIPAASASATMSLYVTDKDETLESIGNLKIYLLPDGTDWTDSAVYVTNANVLATVASATLVKSTTVAIALDVSVLNANSGDDLILLFTTSVEEGGTGSEPTSAHHAYIEMASTITVAFA